jgi:hypothetical protein
MMLICNEGKEDKRYHIAYQINTTSPVIPYCRMVGHLDVLIQVQSENPKICEKCKKTAGISTLGSVPMSPVTELQVTSATERKAIIALTELRAVAQMATSLEAAWWRAKIEASCREAGIDEDEGTNVG